MKIFISQVLKIKTVSIVMELYNQRAVRFFLQSIQTLKKESGGQRWNEICEDTATLFENLYTKEFGTLHLSHTQVWELFFHPPESNNDSLYMRFELLCSNDKFIDFFMKFLQALLDPPASWWRASFP